MIADTYPLLNIFWTMLVFFGFVIFIWLFIVVVIDIFRATTSAALPRRCG